MISNWYLARSVYFGAFIAGSDTMWCDVMWCESWTLPRWYGRHTDRHLYFLGSFQSQKWIKNCESCLQTYDITPSLIWSVYSEFLASWHHASDQIEGGCLDSCFLSSPGPGGIGEWLDRKVSIARVSQAIKPFKQFTPEAVSLFVCNDNLFQFWNSRW